MTVRGDQSAGPRARQWRVSAILVLASLAGAATISACASTVEANGSYAGGGGSSAEVSEDTGTVTVPPPSDPTVSTTPPEVTTASPQEVLAYQCKVVTGYSIEFLPTWKKVSALPTPTTAQRHSVAVAMIASASKVDAYKTQIKDKTLQSFAKKIVAEMKKTAELVDSGSSAKLDDLQKILTDTESYCG